VLGVSAGVVGSAADPTSPHFTDQVHRHIDGKFRDVLFYPEDVRSHTERRYRPVTDQRPIIYC
jgi:acyl-homoserine lactone acylase PvdQ